MTMANAISSFVLVDGAPVGAGEMVVGGTVAQVVASRWLIGAIFRSIAKYCLSQSDRCAN